jgi:hypothetical protein
VKIKVGLRPLPSEAYRVLRGDRQSSSVRAREEECDLASAMYDGVSHLKRPQQPGRQLVFDDVSGGVQ